jgi:hypothetical protein
MKLPATVLSLIALHCFATVAAAADAPPIAAWPSCPWDSADCNVCVADAADSIQRLRSHGDASGFHMNGAPDVEFDHHWQGVQRLMGGAGRYLAISRSLESESTDVSFVVVEMASRDSEGLRYRSNRLNPSWPIAFTAPPTTDRIVLTVPHETGFDHAGGMQALGNVLAVPFEGGGAHSKVVFYDVADPLHPVRLPNVVDHSPLSDDAGTATLGKLANGHFLLVIGRNNANILDFYVSTGTDLRTTGYEWFDTWDEDELTGDDSEFGNYQNLNFIAQCDGTLFMVGTHRNAAGGLGDDFIDLFKVINGAGNDVAIEKVAQKHLFCSGNCDFDAAGGAYVDPRGQLYVYGTTHDNDGAPYDGFGFPLSQCAGSSCSTEFAEFRPVPHDTCEDIETAWAELYDDAGFGDRSLMIDFVDRNLEDYSNFDHAEGFEDKTSSVRWCIPPGAVFRLWQNKNSCGGDHLDLVGDGTFRRISNLDSVSFGDEASCAEWLGGPFARAGADQTIECTGATTPVQLDGRASISLEGGPLTFSWSATGITFDDSSTATPVGSFPLAQTVVTLTVSDSAGSNSDTVNVTIVDTIAPTIACPANVVIDAKTPGGALVDYPNPTAADSCGVRSVSCVPASGSTFPIGTNTVQCTVADGASHTATCSFTVRVKSPAEQLADLVAKINGLAGVKGATKNSFIVKVEAALAALAGGNTTTACSTLQALMQAVQAQAAKELTAAQSADLIADISRIRAALGCL